MYLVAEAIRQRPREDTSIPYVSMYQSRNNFLTSVWALMSVGEGSYRGWEHSHEPMTTFRYALPPVEATGHIVLWTPTTVLDALMGG